MPAPSLLHLATATAIRFVKGTDDMNYLILDDPILTMCFSDLDDLGAMPYSLARPILLNIHNPEKLVRLSKPPFYHFTCTSFSILVYLLISFSKFAARHGARIPPPR